MTMPDECSRAVIQAGAFLKELRANTALPEPVRSEAHRLLRHFPSVLDIERIATFSAPRDAPWPPNPFGGPPTPDWWAHYRFGPVTGSDH